MLCSPPITKHLPSVSIRSPVFPFSFLPDPSDGAVFLSCPLHLCFSPPFMFLFCLDLSGENLFSYSPSIQAFFPFSIIIHVLLFSSLLHCWLFFSPGGSFPFPSVHTLFPPSSPPFPFPVPFGPLCSQSVALQSPPFTLHSQLPTFTLFLGRRLRAGHKPPKDAQVCKNHIPLSAASKAPDQLHIFTYTMVITVASRVE